MYTGVISSRPFGRPTGSSTLAKVASCKCEVKRPIWRHERRDKKMDKERREWDGKVEGNPQSIIG
jgi:hypothetical protein